MVYRIRSTSMKCKCGKVHTFYGQDATDILQMLDACSNNMFVHRFDVTTIGMVKSTFTCCKDPKVEWCNYDIRSE